jgi:hypothetical protein
MRSDTFSCFMMAKLQIKYEIRLLRHTFLLKEYRNPSTTICGLGAAAVV